VTPQERDFLHQTSIPLRTVNRALVLYVTLLAGFWGGHKFLLGARRTMRVFRGDFGRFRLKTQCISKIATDISGLATLRQQTKAATMLYF
jgi:hypothetical protein